MDDASIMVQKLKSTCSNNLPLFVTDELAHYKTVLEEAFSHYEPIPRTGKRGRPANPVRVIDPDLKHSTVKNPERKAV